MIEFVNQNFAATEPIEVDGAIKGVPLHQDLGEPVRYICCNLINREPPAGSVLDRCNTVLRRYGINVQQENRTFTGKAAAMIRGQAVAAVSGQVSTAISGKPVADISELTVAGVASEDVTYGRWTPSGYEYFETPQVERRWRRAAS